MYLGRLGPWVAAAGPALAVLALGQVGAVAVAHRPVAGGAAVINAPTRNVKKLNFVSSGSPQAADQQIG